MLNQKPLSQTFAEWDLTPKQAQIARLVLDGKSFTDIAGQLVMADSTAKNHMTEVYERAEVASRSEFIVKFGRARLTEVVMEELERLNHNAAEVDQMFGNRPPATPKRKKARALRAFDRKAFNG